LVAEATLELLKSGKLDEPLVMVIYADTVEDIQYAVLRFWFNNPSLFHVIHF